MHFPGLSCCVSTQSRRSPQVVTPEGGIILVSSILTSIGPGLLLEIRLQTCNFSCQKRSRLQIRQNLSCGNTITAADIFVGAFQQAQWSSKTSRDRDSSHAFEGAGPLECNGAPCITTEGASACSRRHF